MEVSAYPKALGVGDRSTFYASVYAANGETLPSFDVRWSVGDTSIAIVGGPDDNRRYFATAQKAGTTEVTARCGDVYATTSITIEGGGSPPDTSKPAADTTGAPAAVFVGLNAPSLQPGQTTQATVTGVDGTGLHMTIGAAEWSSSNPSVATITPAGLVTAVKSGTASITATVKGRVGSAPVTVVGSTTDVSDPPPSSGVAAQRPELPRSEVADAEYVPPSGRSIRVGAGDDLQAALNTAQPGDQIVLAAGASFYGNFVLPAKATSNPCTAWTNITSEGSIPSQGTRVTPSSAASFAKIITPNYDAALKTEARSSCWRIVGVEITVSPSFGSIQYGLIFLGDQYTQSLSDVPHGIVLDRIYLHGAPNTNGQRCVALNSARSAIINSWISDCHARSNDSQVIAGWNGPGPYLIENNFLAGSTENIMFGGADPRIAGLSPSDITIRRNHVWKDPAWKGVWLVKNLFELKNARRVLVEGNVFENNWADGQSGMAIVIKSSQDGCGTCTWEGTTDVTLRYNIVRNSPRGLNLQAVDCDGQACVDVHVQRVRAEHNLFENIGTFNGTGDNGWLTLLTHDLQDVGIVHNTFVGNLPNLGISVFMDYSGGAARRIQLDDNVFAGQNYYALFTTGAPRVGTESLNTFAPSSWSFNRNVVASVDPDFVSWHPATSFYPRFISDLGFAGAGDYRLGSASAYRGKASDGTDPGADFTGLAQRTAGVVVR